MNQSGDISNKTSEAPTRDIQLTTAAATVLGN